MLYFFVGFFAPLQSIRLSGFNFTLFDLLIIFSFFYELLRGRVRLVKSKGYWLASFMIAIPALLGAVFSLDGRAAVIQVFQWLFILYVVIPTLYSICFSHRGRKALLLGIIFGGALVSLYSAIDIYRGGGQYLGGRYAGFMGSPQPTSFVMAVLIAYFLSVSLFLPVKSSLFGSFLRGVSIVGGTLSVLVIFYAASRTGVLAVGLVAVLAATALILTRHKRAALRIGKGRYIAVGLVTLMTLLAIPFSDNRGGVNDFIAGSTAKLVERISASSDADSRLIKGRVELLEDGLETVSIRSFVIGYGLDNYIYHADMEKKPHNVIFLYFLEGGVFFLAGLLIIAALFFLYSYKAISVARSSLPLERSLIIASVLSFSVVMVVGLFNTSATIRLYWISFAMLMALVDVGVNTSSKDGCSER